MLTTHNPHILFHEDRYHAYENGAAFLAQVASHKRLVTGGHVTFNPQGAAGRKLALTNGDASVGLDQLALKSNFDEATISHLRSTRLVMDRHLSEIKRKFKKEDGAEVKSELHADLKRLIDDYEAHPLFKMSHSQLLELGSAHPNYKAWRSLKDSFAHAHGRLKGWMQENRWGAIPITAGVLVLKLTVGLWMLHQFDKLFGTKSVQGKPFVPDDQPINVTPQQLQRPQRRHESAAGMTGQRGPVAMQQGVQQPSIAGALGEQPSVAAMNQAFNAPLYVQAQPAYVQPQAAYPQPPPAYAQPQSAYA